MENLVGQQIGRYRITRHLARGGMADVYLAQDTVLDREVCLKLMLPKLMQHEEITKRFYREAEAIASLEHPQIVDIYDIGIAPTTQPYIAMAYVRGGTLEDLIRRRQEQGQPLTAVQTLKIMRKVAAGLQRVHHAGMVHRDLKPSNILMRRGGTPILADLGIVSVGEATRLTRTGQQLGTPYYMAPEQVRGTGVDARTDLYAFGVILYEMLSGQLPFAGKDPVDVMHQHLVQSPPPLEELKPELAITTSLLVHRCLAKDPNDRYADIDALMAALDQAIVDEGGEQIPPPPLSPHPQVEGSEPAAPPTLLEDAAAARSYRWAYLLGAAVLVVLLGWLIWGRDGNRGGGETAVATGDAAQIVTDRGADTAVTPASVGSALPTSTLAAVLPTRTPSPSATPTATSTPSPAPSPTASPSPPPTRTPLPAATVTSGSSTTPATCLVSAGDRWGGTLYAAYATRLGCPQTGENRPSAAYQRYENGLAVWREDADLVYFLLYNGNYLVYPAGVAPPGYFDSQLRKGAFGYYWNTNETVRNSLGQPVEAEAGATQYAVQDFAQGAIFYFLENGANNYVLFADSRVWIATTE